MNWLDGEGSVLHWNSEEIVVPYVNPLDNSTHRYFPDFTAEVQGRQGIMTVMFEIKPSSQTIAPVTRNGRRTKKFLTECRTYVTNQAKWRAADSFCQDHGWKFQIITEKDLGLVK